MQTMNISYTDLNGKVRSEDFYFHMEFIEILEMELSYEGGLQGYLEKLGRTEDGAGAYLLFKELVLKAYGEKSDDGRRFIKKTDDGVMLRDHFEQCPAMSNMIVGFVKDTDSANSFVQGLIPADLVQAAEAEAAKAKEPDTAIVGETKESTPADLPTAPPVLSSVPSSGTNEKKFSDYTREELVKMPKEQWDALVGTDPTNWDKDQLLISYQRKNSE